MLYFKRYVSPLGQINLYSDGAALTGLYFDNQKHCAVNLSEKYEEKPLPIFDLTEKWLDIYFSGKSPLFTPPISLNGVSPFCENVLKKLTEIPYGQTTAYGKLAKQIAEETNKNASAQAVGGAVGRNPVSIIIPCHRVVGANFLLGGYGGGIDKKTELLRLEGVDVSAFTVQIK